ncbi:hypothetical protein ENUP19_0158G0017 [Entamoeba nuttalli]|uniref:TLDc domain-containing protein n=2 Tax=Entamoeba nuttalli TaxID=412467 RepID=K2GT26_ENTNP|nr:hypothetical protein ENU1_212370 [Entamoeba nuttalli P19]EKE37012.1 hypothetical protein ENU1_212370 [Entamoeba nuttalli P19]|eukprot:XP_008860648.1 hypothetical protein ENU1_212370 [Entamoeba nuttalli P19]
MGNKQTKVNKRINILNEEETFCVFEGSEEEERNSNSLFYQTQYTDHYRACTKTKKRFLTPQGSPRNCCSIRKIKSAAFEVPKFDNKSSILSDIENWCCSNQFNILYNSSIDGLTTRAFNSKVCCYSNVLIIVITEDGSIFGCYHPDVICPAQSHCIQKSICKEGFFLFTHNYTTIEKMTKKSKMEEVLTIHPQCESNFVLTIASAFWILADRTVHIHPSLKNHYYVKSPMLNPMLGRMINKVSYISTLLAVECI